MALNDTSTHTKIYITLTIGDNSGVAGAYYALSNAKTAEIAIWDTDRRLSEHEARELVGKLQTLYQAAYADPSTIV